MIFKKKISGCFVLGDAGDVLNRCRTGDYFRALEPCCMIL